MWLCAWAAFATYSAPFDGTFDLVIPWVASTRQSAVPRPRRASLLQASIENNNELTYALRAVEHSGMLAHVRKLFLFMDGANVDAFGAPRNVNWAHPKVHPVYAEDLGLVPAGNATTYSAKAASLHRIPGIGEAIVFFADDVLVTGFAPELLFDGHRARVHVDADPLRSFSPAQCPNKAAYAWNGCGHMPWVVSRSTLGEVERAYQANFTALREGLPDLHDRNLGTMPAFSVPCVYDNYVAAAGLATVTATTTAFGEVCHTNRVGGECPVGTRATAEGLRALLAHPPHFLNLQGDGISDEYAAAEGVHSAALAFLHTLPRGTLTLGPEPSARQREARLGRLRGTGR